MSIHHLNPYLILGGAFVGVLVGMTGAGGGSLMTPMLTVIFAIKVSTAIASDLVATLFIRPVGAFIHGRRGAIQWGVVRWAALGAVPGAILGTALLHVLGDSHSHEKVLQAALGATLLLGAFATAARTLIERGRPGRQAASVQVTPRRAATVAAGAVGGFLVGLTSVGAGSLLVLILLAIYPTLQARQLVGSDLLLAVPLTLAAAVGALLFGHVKLDVSLALVIGAVPGVVVGSYLANLLPDRIVRPAILTVILASGLKYVGADGRIVIAVLAVGLAAVAVYGLRGRLLASSTRQSA